MVDFGNLTSAQFLQPVPDKAALAGPGIVARIQLLGVFSAKSVVGENICPKSRKAQALLVLLAAARGDALTRSRLAGLLWDRVSEEQARASLRQTVRDLHSVLGPHGKQILSIDRDMLRLDPDRCWVDSKYLDERIESKALFEDEAARRLVGLPFLDRFESISAAFDDWVVSERARREFLLGRLLDDRLALLAGRNAPAEEVIEAARLCLSVNATGEPALRALMSALAECGDRAGAIREYLRFRDLLVRDLDLSPSAKTRQLFEEIRHSPASGVVEPPVAPPQKASAGAKKETDRFKLGVISFRAVGGAEADTLSDVISHDIAGALARFRWFDVLAPYSLAVGQEGRFHPHLMERLNLDYLVDGSVKLSGGESAITVRLVDLRDFARPVWSESFGFATSEFGSLSAQITSKIVASIDPVIISIEGRREFNHSVSESTLLVLRAVPLMYRLDRAGYEQAGRMLSSALAIDPDHAMAAAWAAYWYVFYIGQGWSKDNFKDIQNSEAMCLRAIKSDPNNAEAIGIYGHCCSFLHHRFDDGVFYLNRSLELNPNLSFTWALSAVTSCYIGDPDDALRKMQRYKDLSPFDPYYAFFETVFTIAYTLKGDYERAIIFGTRTVRSHPNFTNAYKPLLSSLGWLGRAGEAQEYLQRLLALEPDFTAEKFQRVYPLQCRDDRDRYVEGLIRAGVARR